MTEQDASATLARLRREYGDHGLDLGDLDDDPVEMFRRWLDEAVASGLHEPNAMVVTSVSAAGRKVTSRERSGQYPSFSPQLTHELFSKYRVCWQLSQLNSFMPRTMRIAQARVDRKSPLPGPF